MAVIGQIGDFHARQDARNADRYRVLDTIIETGRRTRRYGGTFWPGDLNDAKMTIADKNALCQRVLRLAELGPVFIARGNHDAEGDLDFLALLETQHRVYVANDPMCVRATLATGEFITVFMMPYPNKARLVGAGVAPGDIVTTATAALIPIFMQAAIDLEAARQVGDLTAMIGHFNVCGSRTVAAGQPSIGREIELSAHHLDLLGPIFKGLNHIHLGQQIAGAWYAGSTYRQNHGEVDAKRWLLVDIAADSSYTVHEEPLDIPPMFHVEGALTRTFGFVVDSEDEEVHRRFAADDWTGCDVRVRYSYFVSEKEVVDHYGVADRFKSALRLKVEPVAVPDRKVRAPEVAAATTLAGKIAAYQKAPITPALGDKLAALEHGDPADILAGVDRQLAELERVGDAAAVLV